ncbi:uncharacterized protein [Primulina eburnea]|uniref:uncharacterized protein n=1 Tax=Primulina eburnea TaxID=1245227 RepID=UPI003C6C56D0
MEKKRWRENEETPIIIAMKGHPGTGKSTIARAVAKTLRCPLIDKDHFRDGTQRIQQALMLSSPSTANSLLNDISYEAMWRVTSTQIGLGLSVVVDSPLSRRAHLDRLLDLACQNGARLIVVECRAGDEDEWRRRLEARGRVAEAEKWHKPATWGELERLLEGYGGCWDYDVGEVGKLVLDTTASVDVSEMVSIVIQFLSS